MIDACDTPKNDTMMQVIRAIRIIRCWMRASAITVPSQRQKRRYSSASFYAMPRPGLTSTLLNRTLLDSWGNAE